ncbi:MAG: FAD-binding domain-containing protein, partial [Pseudomonadota bacterium]
MLIQNSIPDATRSNGLDVFRDFLPRAGRNYAERRNFDLGPSERDNVSVLSPFIRHRLVLESEVLKQVVATHSRETADKFIQEVFWRAYFKGWLEQHPSVWHDYRREVNANIATLESDADACAAYDRAVSGATGIDCFDAWVEELVRTGYLHNHARMWFASIWIFTLELPWQLGADFFLRNLLDGDPASNTLSWRWVGGLHTRGKTYLARLSNITSYTNDRFNPVGQLAATAPPLSESATHERMPLPEADRADIDGPFGLLVTEEDCVGQPLPVEGEPKAVIGLSATSLRSPLAVSQGATAFAADAVRDGAMRAAESAGREAEFSESSLWDDDLLEFAKRHDLRKIVTAYAPIGPVAEQLDRAATRLAESGVQLRRVRRGYDERAWPYAANGYFKLKARIPDLL